MLASTVIGAGFGDEGKGLVTDWLARKYEHSLVIRYNGGAQCSHTVVDGNKRHVFGHIGAGALAEASTYLSKYFVCNPMTFKNEFSSFIGNFNCLPPMFYDKRAIVTTPYDVVINQLIEQKRRKKHGSCGIGLWETIKRNKLEPFKFSIAQVDIAKRLLAKIKTEYVPQRLNQLKLKTQFYESDFWQHHDQIIIQYLNDLTYFMVNTQPLYFLNYNHLIFEGAQGLGLDQAFGTFPYVTPSNTGLKNIINLCRSVPSIRELNVYYVTRSYLTRHGAGPMPNPETKLYPNAIETTNVYNPFQCEFRFAPLNLNFMLNLIDQDLVSIKPCSIKLNLNLVVTCMDQIDHDQVYVIEYDRLKSISPEQFKALFQKYFENLSIYFSYGPEAKSIVQVS
jgi:adenylosuccinate synthase